MYLKVHVYCLVGCGDSLHPHAHAPAWVNVPFRCSFPMAGRELTQTVPVQMHLALINPAISIQRLQLTQEKSSIRNLSTSDNPRKRELCLDVTGLHLCFLRGLFLCIFIFFVKFKETLVFLANSFLLGADRDLCNMRPAGRNSNCFLNVVMI